MGMPPTDEPLSLFHILHQLVIVISDLTAGVMAMPRVIGQQIKH